ncbi:MAG: DUF1311 domain-containing protein [Methylobacteriaceae bacterium]|nr:DUF1311 domain-containing protein [Methylobacteriaceae bacterium]
MRRTAFAIIGFFATVASAAAMDCKAAKSDIEKAICASPLALAADEAMVAAYNALRQRVAPAERAALLVAQRNWLKRQGAAADPTNRPMRNAYGRHQPAPGPFSKPCSWESGPGVGSALPGHRHRQTRASRVGRSTSNS